MMGKTSNIISKLNIFACLSFLFIFVAGTQPVLAGKSNEVNPSVQLTEQEQTWLTAHQDIKFLFHDQTPPLIIPHEDNTFTGLLVDFLKTLNSDLNTAFEIDVLSSQKELVQSIKHSPNILALSQDFIQNSDLLSTTPITTIYPTVFAFKGTSFTSLDDFTGKTIVLDPSIGAGNYIITRFGSTAHIIEVDSTLKSLQMVFEGKADFAIGNNFHTYLIAQNHMWGLYPAFIVHNMPIPIVMGVSKELPELVSILNKWLVYASEEKIPSIIGDWLNSDQTLKKPISLSDKELLWLAKHHTIRVGADPSWAPLEFRDNDGKYKGLCIDYLKKIEPLLGVKFEFIREDWQQLITMAKEKKLDMFSSVSATKERDKYLIFTDPYHLSPSGFFTRKETSYISDINKLIGKKVAVIDNYAIHDHMVANHPDVDLLLVKTVEQGLRAVIEEQAFVFVGNVITTGYLISENKYTDLKLAGESPFTFKQAMGVRIDWPELRSILQKALDTISDAERNHIYNQWVPHTYEQQIDYSLFWKTGGTALFVFCLILFWNRRLATEVKNRTKSLVKANQRYQEAQKITHLGHWDQDISTQELVWSDEVYRIFEVSKHTTISLFDNFKSTVHPEDLDLTIKTYQDSVDSNTPYRFIHRLLMNDGRIKFVKEMGFTEYDENGVPLKSLGTVQDITEQAKIEQKLQQAQKMEAIGTLAGGIA
ncbi:MAG: transporter substrate-binding domain-containing protein, partial [Desulfocapsa sp.]|nr:transporter substrate-binding domain-containing protein [Desulfocapsa sp.]